MFQFHRHHGESILQRFQLPVHAMSCPGTVRLKKTHCRGQLETRVSTVKAFDPSKPNSISRAWWHLFKYFERVSSNECQTSCCSLHPCGLVSKDQHCAVQKFLFEKVWPAKALYSYTVSHSSETLPRGTFGRSVCCPTLNIAS